MLLKTKPYDVFFKKENYWCLAHPPRPIYLLNTCLLTDGNCPNCHQGNGVLCFSSGFQLWVGCELYHLSLPSPSESEFLYIGLSNLSA